MKEAVTKFGPILKRIFHTNALTSIGGLICGLGVLLLFKKIIDQQAMLEVLGAGTTVIGLGAKDGMREGSPLVAPESLDAPDVAGPGKMLTVLLLLALAGLTSACGSAPVARALQTPGRPALSAGPVAAPLTYEATPDSLVPPPSYLAQPPAGLTKRQLRQFRRAQRQALIEAARLVPAKIKLAAGSAYAAPGATAVALRKPAGPVGIGAGAEVTDYSHFGEHANGGVGAAGGDWTGEATGATVPAKPTLGQRVAQLSGRVMAGLLLAGSCWLLFLPIGAGGVALPLMAAVFRRRKDQNPTA